MIIFQNWCKYLKGNRSFTLFFDLFKVHYGLVSQMWGISLVSLDSTIRSIRAFSENLQHFKDQLFLITLIHPEAHVTVYTIGNEVDGKCTELFLKYWTERHFLMGNEVYVYKEKDLFEEDTYQKKRLISLVKDLSYIGRGIPYNQDDRKHLKFLIDTRLLVEAYTREGRSF